MDVASGLWRTACLLALPLVFGNAPQGSPNHVLEHTDTCPDSGYYYQPADLGCYLCFCQNNTASCWKRENSCGVQIHQIADSPSGNRVRRSPIGLSDIFFRDVTRDFFTKQLPEQCKPHEGSFSDGCPPADWCVGCTVCDCDANGRWDCHILSFCNGEEKKKRKKNPLPKSMPSRRVYHKGRATPKNHVTPKPKKGVKKSIPKPQRTQRRSQSGRIQNNVKKLVGNDSKKNGNNSKKSSNNKKPNNTYRTAIAKRPNNKGRKPNINKTPSNHNKKPNKPQPKPKKAQPKVRPKSKPKPNSKPKPKPKPKPTTKKPHTKKYMVKKNRNKTTVTTELPKITDAYRKILRKRVTTSTEIPSDEVIDEKFIKDHFNFENSNHSQESELGRKIVKKMMGTVQRMLGQQMERLQNRSRVGRSTVGKNNCVKNNTNNKKISKSNYMIRKKKLKNQMPWYDINSIRKKREALDLDLSLIDLNEANLINDSIDLSVKRITKNITDFDFNSNINSNEVNTTYTALTDLEINTTYTDLSAQTQTQAQTDVKNGSRNLNTSDFNNNGSNINGSNTFFVETDKLKPNDSTTDLSDNIGGNLTSNLTTEKISTTSEILNTAGTQYFKYSVDRNFSTSSFTTELATSTTVSNRNSTTQNPTSVTKKRDTIKNITKKATKGTTEFVLISNKAEFSDLKHKKWERMKILRDSIIQVNQISKFNNNKGFNSYTIDSSLLTQLKNKKNIQNLTKKFGFTKKYNLKKVITNFNTDDLLTVSLSTTQLPPKDFSRNMSSLQVLLKSLMHELNNNTTSPSKLRTKFSLFKYLRNIFKKIFSRKKGKHYMGHQTNEAVTLQILCENIGACYLNRNNRIALRNKIHDLNAETEKIFKTIKIIKGLLSLMVLPVVKNNSTTTKPPKDEILKLDAILRGNYEENSTLTETQAAQISYVKNNVHQFVESVGKFATILNDILNVLYENNKKYSCQRSMRYFNKKKKLNAFNKIKNLLVKYNIIQNTFMKKMYKLLTDVEKNMPTEKPEPKVSDRDLNNTQVIDRYSKNIVQNLRKLKDLAQTLSSRRKKRQSMRQDNAIEYLLLLMEHLLKQSYPLDNSPVNDGIDLLIEAIQNAPDIKTIKKKVLDEPPTTQRVTRTASNLRYFNEHNNTNFKRLSKEHNNIFKNDKTIEVDKSINKDEETITVYYKRFDKYDNPTDSVTTEYPRNISDEVKNEEKIGFDKFESQIDDTRRYEVFTSDSEDEPILPVVINTTNLELTTIAPDIEQTTYIQNYKLDDEPGSSSKPKLDWIEESFIKEIKDYTEAIIFNTTTTQTTQRTTTIKPEVLHVDNISSLTVEVEDEKKKAKAASDEVLNRKEIGFLNSLDYGTEKSEIEDSELKDDEKFSGDFPSYFVK